MKLGELLNKIEYTDLKNFSERPIDHVISDSREKFKNSIFIAVKGLTSDGAEFADDAINAGSVAVIYETEIKRMHQNVVYIKVSNSRKIQSLIAGLVYSEPSKHLNLVGVTGTNGKTSSAYIYRHILKQNNIKCCLLGTTEYDLGRRKFTPSRTTPDAVFLQRYFKEILESGAKNAVMEVSSHALVLNRVEEVFFDTAIFTNLTRDHLDFHKTMDEYAAAKSSLFSQHLKSGGLSVINIDDDHSGSYIKSAPYGIKTFAANNPDADLSIENIAYTANGMQISYKYENSYFTVSTNLSGRFQAYNIAGAILSSLRLGIRIENVVQAFLRPMYIPGRMEKVFDGDFQIIIDYAHTPDALYRTIKTINEFKKGKLITVFGCGGNRDQEKRPLMGQISASNSDITIVTSDNPRDEEPDAIISEITAGISSGSFEVISDRKAAIKRSIESAVKGDIILVAGKGHETYQEIKGVKYPYSDSETIQNLTGSING